jgi:hypothetical protein
LGNEESSILSGPVLQGLPSVPVLKGLLSVPVIKDQPFVSVLKGQPNKNDNDTGHRSIGHTPVPYTVPSYNNDANSRVQNIPNNKSSNNKCNDDHDNDNNTNYDSDNDENHAHTMSEINDIIKNNDKSDVNITNNISTKIKNKIKKSSQHHESISPGFHAYDNDGDIGISGIYIYICVNVLTY